jgi:hypothetical protein
VDMTIGAGSDAPDLAVVYLNRAKTQVEIKARERFILAYQRFKPKVQHSLYIVNKGFEKEERAAQYVFFKALKPRFIDVDDEGFDLSAYRKAAQQIDQPIIFFMNTHSEPLQQEWLDNVYACLKSSTSIGLVGCTGNVETHHPFVPDFPEYPNYHVRSNAFIIARQDYLNILGDCPLNNKIQAYQLEAGRRSLTRMIQASGRQALVVGRQGVVKPQNLWRAGIFRSGFQQNLLLADNQTRHYQQAILLKKLMIWMVNYSRLSQVYPYQRLRYYLFIRPLSLLRAAWISIQKIEK